VHRFVVSVLIIGTFCVPCVAQVQPGSTGGSIGKTEKSISGGEEARKIQSKNPSARATGSQCDKVAGSWTWRWLNDSAVVTLSSGGASSATNGNEGNWTCVGRMVRVNWLLGNYDTLTLSSDAKTLSGKSVLGISVSGTRINGP